MSAAIDTWYRLDGDQLCRAKAGLQFAMAELDKLVPVEPAPAPPRPLADIIRHVRELGSALSIMELPHMANEARQAADDLEAFL